VNASSAFRGHTHLLVDFFGKSETGAGTLAYLEMKVR